MNASPPSMESQAGIPGHLLVIEDDAGLRESLRQELAESGLTFHGAASGQHALDWLAHRQACLILLDCSLPDMTAPQLVEAVVRNHSMLPFIILIGAGDERIALELMKRGARDYLVKDPNLLVLLPSVVGRVLKEIESQQRLRESEEALRESEANLRAILANTDDIIASYDREVRLVVFNEACREAYGRLFGVEIHQGLCTLDLFPESMREFWRANNARALAGEAFCVEFEIGTADIGRRVFESSFHPIRYGSEVVGFSTTTRDISNRKQAEEALRKSEERYRMLIENSPDAVGIIQGRKLVFVNPTTIRLLGAKSREELVGLTSEQVIHAEDLPGSLDRLQRLARGESGLYPAEVRYLRRDGSTAWGEIIVSVIEFGGEPAFQFVARDISDRKKASLLLTTRAELADRAREGALDDLLQLVLDRAEQLTDSCIGFFHFVDADQENLRLQTWSTNTLKNMCTAEGKGWHYPVEKAGVWADSLRSRKPIIHNDYANLSHKKGLPPGHARVVREAVVPVVRHGLVVCIMGVGNKPTDYTSDDLRLLTDLASVAADQAIRYRTEEALRESEYRYRLLHNLSVDVILLHQVDGTQPGRIIEVNDVACRRYGYSREEMLRMTPMDLDAPEGLARMPQAMEWLLTEKQAMWEGMHCTQDGRKIPVEIVAVLFEHQGELLILSSSRDITVRKQAEEALRLDEERLEVLLTLNNMTGASERELTHFAMEAAVRLTNSAIGYIAFVNENETVLTMQAWSDQAMGECATVDRPLEFPVAKSGLWGEAVRQRKAIITNDYAAPNPWKKGTPDGHVRLTRHMNAPTMDGERIVIVAGVGNKPTDYGNDDVRQMSLLMSGLWTIIRRKRVEAEQERLQAQLTQAQKMESVGRLAGGVAHDFNNMLQAILGNAALALMELPPGSPVREGLEEIERSAQRSADLTRQLLAFARKQTIAPKVLDLNEAVGGMIKMLRRLIGEDIELVWVPGSKLGLVKVDPSQVDQVLANLCVNARDAIGGKVGRVAIETENAVIDQADVADRPEVRAGDYVRLTVSDNGCGMSPEVRSHLFEPFFTTKELGKGTGLGLATVYGIVAQNDGYISVYSEPGKGTSFRIHLPRYTAPPPEPSRDDSSPAPSRGQETVLLVEDEPSILRVSLRMLESLGYSVLVATTPEEAIQLARKHVGGIHLLMTDVVMPEMNGRELARHLQNLCPGLKQLFVSGYTDDVIAHHGVLDAGVHFLKKPYSFQALANKVREALND